MSNWRFESIKTSTVRSMIIVSSKMIFVRLGRIVRKQVFAVISSGQVGKIKRSKSTVLFEWIFFVPVDRCEDFANSTAETFRVYIDLNNSTEKLVELYKTLSGPSKFRRFRFESIELPSNENDPIFKYVLDKNIHLIGCAALFYVFSLIYFVKNSFFILTIFLNVVLSLTLSSWIYLSLLKYPWTILNFSSLILYGFIVLIDSFLWFVCWTNNNHRRDDCTVHRIIENLLTQAFYYFLPKTLTLIIVLVITFTNQIIALQAFAVQTILLISVSFLVSFLLFPGKFFLSDSKVQSLKFSFSSLFHFSPSLSIVDSDAWTDFHQANKFISRSRYSSPRHSIKSTLFNIFHRCIRCFVFHYFPLAQIGIRRLSNIISNCKRNGQVRTDLAYRFRFNILHGRRLGSYERIVGSIKRYFNTSIQRRRSSEQETERNLSIFRRSSKQFAEIFSILFLIVNFVCASHGKFQKIFYFLVLIIEKVI